MVNNLAAAGVAAALGQLTIDETAADLPWQMVVVDVPVLLAYTLVVLWLAKRKRIAVVSPAGPERRAALRGPDEIAEMLPGDVLWLGRPSS